MSEHIVTQSIAMEDELMAVLPPRLRSTVAWVYARQFWGDVEVAFYMGGGDLKRVRVPKSWWLDERAISKICLEAP
jgi:hypothetical protein